jgi:hypothetical protein
MQGNATLESGAERIISTVGPFSFFAASALLAENKTVKDVHQFLDHLFTINNTKSHNKTNLLDEISSIFYPDYNLIVNSELHILQIHRLVWLAAIRATQRQRSNDQYQRRMQPEQLLSNALDEIVKFLFFFIFKKISFFFMLKSSVTNVPIDKNNLTNFQRIFRNEKEITQTKNENSLTDGQPSSLIFNAIHSLDKPISIDTHKQDEKYLQENQLSDKRVRSTTAIACNPLLLTLPSYEPPNADASNMENCNTSTPSLNQGVFDTMFDDSHDHVNIILFYLEY